MKFNISKEWCMKMAALEEGCESVEAGAPPSRGFTLCYDIASQAIGITCDRCGKTSYNENDVREEYCGHCHWFLGTAERVATEFAELFDEAARKAGFELP